MSLDARYRCVGTFVVFALAALDGTATAQTRRTAKPQQAATGAEDAAAGASAAARRREQKLEQELAAMTSRSDKGLRIVKHSNGTETVYLQGRFMSVAVATPQDGGGEAVSCQIGSEAVESARRTRPAAKANAPVLPEEK